MKNKQMIYGLFGALSLVGAVNAQDYPAADFQPKVIYASPEAAVPAASSAPASTANPCVTAAISESKVEQTDFDPKYPAASFQPKVIYNSADAK